MAKYRKKPIIIEAEQFFSNNHPCPDGVQGGAGIFWISTLEGDFDVIDGDWIITGIQGEKYPCKPEIFEATYELEEPYEEWLKKSIPLWKERNKR